MPKGKTTDTASDGECVCGSLTPQKDDEEIPIGTEPQQVLAKIMLNCDDNTGVFFFRSDQSLYLRIVTVD